MELIPIGKVKAAGLSRREKLLYDASWVFGNAKQGLIKLQAISEAGPAL